MVSRSIAHYTIVEKLGEGGMGVVYKARDTRLDRFVALKLLPADRVADPERLARFVQEAKSASSLNHPNIVTIHDIGHSEGAHFIAMEFIDGKTLDDLIPRKGLRLKEVLHYAIQIADALTRAHSAGIIHRDLKPSNIIVTESGLVKVLDFGLAKLTQPESSTEDASTRTFHALTDEGKIVGTASYMSPEQAEGKRIDGRSDIFSFGSVLYKMVTGSRAFAGETEMSTVAAILTREPPPPASLVDGLPNEMERIIARCLRKDPARRFQHMEDLKVALDEIKEESESGKLTTALRAAAARRTPRLLLAATACAAAAVTIAGYWYYQRRVAIKLGQTASLTASGRLTMVVSSNRELLSPAISPDGKMVVYAAEEDGRIDLFAGRAAGGARVRLTNDEAREERPEFSPDGERISFTRFGAESRMPEVRVIPALGGPSSLVVSNAMDSSWSPDGKHLVFVLVRPGEPFALAVAAPDGSEMKTLPQGGCPHPFLRHPVWSPDGSRLAVTCSSGGLAGELWLVPVAGGAWQRVSNEAPGIFCNRPVFTPDGRGLVYESNRAGATNLWLRPLGAGPLKRLTTGPGPDESPSVSRDGAILFTNSITRSVLFLCDLVTGAKKDLLTDRDIIWAPSFSPDGREVAFSRSAADGAWHIWAAPVEQGSPRQVTSGKLPEIYPRYFPDGNSILYCTWSSGTDGLWRVPRSGGPPSALSREPTEDEQYADISPDGKTVAFARSEKQATRIWKARADGSEAARLIDTESTTPRWSPDGKWIAFSRSRSHSGGIYLIRPDGSGLRKLSESGSWPVWFPDGRQIAFLDRAIDGSEQIYTTSMDGGPVRLMPRPRFSSWNHPFDISRDGSRLVSADSVVLSSEIWLLGQPPTEGAALPDSR